MPHHSKVGASSLLLAARMPHFSCFNHLVVRGPEAAVAAFATTVELSPHATSPVDAGSEAALEIDLDDEVDYGTMSLAILLPPPASVAADATAILNWRRVHWGPRWDVGTCHMGVDDGLRSYAFNSVTRAPTEWLIAIVSRFQELCGALHYVRPRAFYGGTLTFQHGRVSSHRHITTDAGVQAKLRQLNELYWQDDRRRRAILEMAALPTPHGERLREFFHDRGVRLLNRRPLGMPPMQAPVTRDPDIEQFELTLV